MPGWVYFIFGLVAWQIFKALALIAQQEIRHYRERRFLRFVRVTVPGTEEIKVIVISTSDRKTFNNLRQQLQEQYDITARDPEEGRRS